MVEKYDRDGIPIKPTRRKPTRRGPGAFGLVADDYLRAGYLPVPVAGKILQVKDATGYDGVVTPEKVQQWKMTFATADTALRLEGCLGIDVDHRDDKYGAFQLQELEEELGPLPPTFSITSRGVDSRSRTYLFSVEQDCPRRSKAAKDIEIVHKFHRYAVTFPTIHPDTGQQYEWYSPEGEVLRTWLPTPSELPALPKAWDNYLQSRASSRRDRAGRGIFSGVVDLWEPWLGFEEPTPPARDLIDQIQAEPHIGHDELLHFIIAIHEARALSFELGLGHAVKVLKEKYFAETNDPDPPREWDNIVRWVLTDSWSPTALGGPPLSSLYNSIIARWTNSRNSDR
jgi:hypothetical protein